MESQELQVRVAVLVSRDDLHSERDLDEYHSRHRGGHGLCQIHSVIQYQTQMRIQVVPNAARRSVHCTGSLETRRGSLPVGHRGEKLHAGCPDTWQRCDQAGTVLGRDVGQGLQQSVELYKRVK